MANIQVTQTDPSGVWQLDVITANRNLIVTVTLTGIDFSVYWRVRPRNIDFKAVRLQIVEFTIFNGESIDAMSMGTGTIQVDTRNA